MRELEARNKREEKTAKNREKKCDFTSKVTSKNWLSGNFTSKIFDTSKFTSKI